MKCDPSHGYIPLAQAISVAYNACRHESDTRTNAPGIFLFWGEGGGGGVCSILLSSKNVISWFFILFYFIF